MGHGCNWTVHAVLGEDPWKAGPPKNNEPPLDRPPSTQDEWAWREEPPKDWSPQVKVEADRVIVTFFTYCGLEKQRIFRHTDTYRPGKYRPKVAQTTIAEGPAGFLF